MVNCQFHTQVQGFQSDWGGEFRPLVSVLAAQGIHFQHPCPHIHSQNGRVERKHQHVVDMGLTLLAQSNMPFTFWWDAFHTATHLIIRLPTPTLQNKSPYQSLFHTIPSYTTLKPFGCSCFPYLKPYNSHKLQFRSTKCVFLGYSDSYKGYKCLSPQGRTYISDTVLFNEQEFPYTTLFPSESASAPPFSAAGTSQCMLPILPLPQPTRLQSPPHSPSVFSNSSSQSSSFSQPDTDTSSTSATSTASQSSQSTSTPSSSSISHSPSPPHSPHSPSPPPVHLTKHSMTTRSKNGIFKPKVLVVSTTDAKSVLPVLPKNDDEAFQHPGWLAALKKEFSAIQSKET